MRIDRWNDDACPIARAMSVLGQRWAVLIIREAMLGRSRFSEFREQLGVASDVLSDRLSQLVAVGILEDVEYQRPGDRTRRRYTLTDVGRDLAPVLGAMGKWGRVHLARPYSSAYHFVDTATGEPVSVSFCRQDGTRVRPADVTLLPGEQ
ncbi:helix-turn-helix domain-containing protein [Streptomyces sp. VRA16 Mangrove soil]|uniref:winged helix-turn-helix transcriptional regulator n=1 Tax=Streptomyces sp. VRA16 Mangrove soil TaxID=2817434 RepID=UPI001A9D3F2A|nr:helix-turn-helix domain-containing protein [Streptomyces sp. VRA16 Mangrove soil]MBO1334374.1 helix-turn-helix transcriptional regulator [Streptomyces sp. VRA16 Mangrove soil]